MDAGIIRVYNKNVKKSSNLSLRDDVLFLINTL